MLRRAVSALFAVLIIVGIVDTPSGGRGARTSAPSGTPVPGVTTEWLGGVVPEDDNGDAMRVARITLAPGASVPAELRRGALVFTVESGTVALAVTSGEVWRPTRGPSTEACAGGCKRATPPAQGACAGACKLCFADCEAIVAGSEVMLGPGNWVAQSGDAAFGYRNTGDGGAVVIISWLGPANDLGDVGIATEPVEKTS